MAEPTFGFGKVERQPWLISKASAFDRSGKDVTSSLPDRYATAAALYPEA
jgi:hypothetical protein